MPGETGLTTEAKAKEYAGFTPQAISQGTVNADGSTVVEIIYERNYYTLTWNTGENASYIAPEQVRYGAAVTKPDKDPTKVGYEFKGWENLPETMTMPAGDLVVTAKWEAAKRADYKIIYWTETVKVRDCGYRGILAIEYFIKGGEIYFNEMAPRPHNSGHYTIEGATTNQFRELVRYLVGEPLQEPQPVAPTVMKNILGSRGANRRGEPPGRICPPLRQDGEPSQAQDGPHHVRGDGCRTVRGRMGRTFCEITDRAVPQAASLRGALTYTAKGRDNGVLSR